MCRMCICEVDSGRGPQLMPTCMATVTEGMKVEPESPTSKRVQEGIIELLLANHPLDCPVCDKGGECPLQDQSFSHGPGESRYVEEKRHYEKPIPISDLVYLDRERCILCDRCTRFADEVAGDALIHFTHRGNNTQVNTFPDEPFASYFSGNTVQICPVGALTAKPYRFQARPWDLERDREHLLGLRHRLPHRRAVVAATRWSATWASTASPSTGVGCATRAASASRRRTAPSRVVEPLVRQGDALVPTSWNVGAARGRRADPPRPRRRRAGQHRRARRGPRHATRTRYAWARLAHEVIGTPNVYCADRRRPARRRARPGRAPRSTRPPRRRRSCCSGRTSRRSCRVLYLRIRDAADARQEADHRVRAQAQRPDGAGVALGAATSPAPRSAAMSQLLADRDRRRAARLRAGRGHRRAAPTWPSRSTHTDGRARRPAARAVPGAKVLPAMRRGNVVGALQLGMRPGRGRQVHARACCRPPPTGRIELPRAARRRPAGRLPRQPTSSAGRWPACRRIIAVDTFLNRDQRSSPTSCCPRRAAGEKRGTHTNIEGRVSQVDQKVTPRGTTRPDWMIAAELGARARHRPRLGRASTSHRRDRRARCPAYAGVTADGAGRVHATASSPACRRRSTDDHRAPSRPCRTATATTSASWSAARCTTRRIGTCSTPVAGPAAKPVADPPPPARPRARSAPAAAPRSRSPASAASVVLRRRGRRRRAARHGVGAVQPAGAQRRRPHRLHRTRSPTSGSRTCDARSTRCSSAT